MGTLRAIHADITTLCVALESDAEAIAHLVNAAYRPEPGTEGWTHEGHLVAGPRIAPEQVRALPGERSVVLVLEGGGQIRACVHVKATDSVAYIGMLATAPAFQAQGLGKQLLGQAEAHAVDHYGVTRFRMSVLSSRPELLAFYERRGYARTGDTETYPPESEVGQPKVPDLHLIWIEKPVVPP
jgi:ribosomal protein S18 acetylase RimI-like enzyme